MDLTLLQRQSDNNNETEEGETVQSTAVLHKRPKLSFSVASLLASAAGRVSDSPDPQPAPAEEEEVTEAGEECSDDESEVSVDSHGEEEAGPLYTSRLNDSSDLEGDPGYSRPVSPPRSDCGPAGRLAVPAPRLGLPGLLTQLPGLPPPGWPPILPPALSGLNPALFKSG